MLFTFIYTYTSVRIASLREENKNHKLSRFFIGARIAKFLLIFFLYSFKPSESLKYCYYYFIFFFIRIALINAILKTILLNSYLAKIVFFLSFSFSLQLHYKLIKWDDYSKQRKNNWKRVNNNNNNITRN